MRKLQAFTLLIAFLITSYSSAQNIPNAIWDKTYGDSSCDVCKSVVLCEDGGFALAGYTYSFGVEMMDFWLVKTDENGDSCWSKTFGLEYMEECNSVIQSYDGGFVLVGYSLEFSALMNSDIFMVKTDPEGNTLWSRLFSFNSAEYGRSVIQTSDGGYAVGGYVHSYFSPVSDFLLIKCDSLGRCEWWRTYDFGEHESLSQIIQTPDDCYVMAGRKGILSTTNRDFLLAKVDGTGNLLWWHTYDEGSPDDCHSAIQTEDYGFLLAGQTFINGGNDSDIYIVKTDSFGNCSWSRVIEGDSYECCWSAKQTSDGGYALLGHSHYPAYDVILVKTDQYGYPLWTNYYGGLDGEMGYSLAQIPEEGFILAGMTNSFGAGNCDFWLVRVDSAGGNLEILNKHSLTADKFCLISNYPNPFNSSTTITFTLDRRQSVKLVINDVLGRQITVLANGIFESGECRIPWDADGSPSGMYYSTIIIGNRRESAPLLLLK